MLSPEKIPVEGMLGLLALGDVGLRAWREAKRMKLPNEKDKKVKSSGQ